MSGLFIHKPNWCGVNWGHPGSAGLIHCWPLCEGVGGGVRNVVGGHDGVLHGMDWGLGAYGRELRSTGASGGVNVGNVSLPASKRVTLVVLFRSDDVTKTQRVFAQGGSPVVAGNNLSLQIFASEIRAIIGQNGGAQFVGTGAGVASGQWHQVVLTYDGSYARVYVDGVLDVEEGTSVSLGGTALACRIGGRANGASAEKFEGSIAYVGLYGTVWDAGMVRESGRDVFGLFRGGGVSTGLFGALGRAPIVAPTSEYADDPARWLVVYNRDDADSTAWAEWYEVERGIPRANMLGLTLPTDESISESEFVLMRGEIADYLEERELGGQVIGILCGHGIPGSYVRGDGVLESIAGQLHRIDGSTGEFGNGLAPQFAGATLDRPTMEMLGGNRLTARIDGEDVVSSQEITNRAKTLETEGLVGDANDPGAEAKIWLDPYGPVGGVFASRQGEMVAWASGLARQRLRLPLELSADGDPVSNVAFTSIEHDGFYFGWEEGVPPSGFFDAVGGKRVFAMQLGINHSTGDTLRDDEAGNWVTEALKEGYAGSGGSTRSISSGAVLRVEPFMEALRLGWTLGEAWYVASPVLRSGLMLVGDPFLNMSFPKGGWNVYGPAKSIGEIDYSGPTVMLREVERELALGSENMLLDGEAGVYIVRHVDDKGREERGLRHVKVKREGDFYRSVPVELAFPRVGGWSPRWVKDAWQICGVWPIGFDEGRIVRVELLEEEQGGEVIVAEGIDAGRRSSSACWLRVPRASVVRYAIRAITEEGVVLDGPWSRWMTVGSQSAIELTTV